MTRRNWFLAVVIGCAFTAVLGGWTYYLSGQTLDVMDKSSSILSGILAIVSLFVTALAIVQAARSKPAPPNREATEQSRTLEAGDVSNSNITLGDNSPITRRDR